MTAEQGQQRTIEGQNVTHKKRRGIAVRRCVGRHHQNDAHYEQNYTEDWMILHDTTTS